MAEISFCDTDTKRHNADTSSLSLAKQHFQALAFPWGFCQIWSGIQFPGFRNNNFVTEQGRQPCVQFPTWTTRSLYLCGPVIYPNHRVPFRRLLRPVKLRWRHSNPPPHGDPIFHHLTETKQPTNTSRIRRFLTLPLAAPHLSRI
jgi:hypothetical protein